MKRLKPYISLSAMALAVVMSQLVSCEKKPASSTPGTVVEQTSVSESLKSELVVPVDTIVPDTTATEPKETPRVMTAETSELIEYMDASPDAEKYAAGILHRMAYDSPEYTRKLINSNYPGFIIVDKQAMQLALFDRYGREELRYGIACGKNFGTKIKKGDSRTSEGFFAAEGIYDSTDWLYTDDNGKTSKVKGQFGPRFIRLLIPNVYSIGIHGTIAPWSIGSRASHGCIRVKNENILELVKHVQVGMPIIVSPSNRDMAANKKEGKYVSQVTINPRSPRSEIAEKEAERARHKATATEKQTTANELPEKEEKREEESIKEKQVPAEQEPAQENIPDNPE